MGAIFAKASGRVLKVSPKDGKEFTLDELQAYVGGMIDVIPIGKHYLMVVNDEGKLKELPINALASREYKKFGGEADIFGNVIISDKDFTK